MHRLQILLSNARKTKDIRSIMVLSGLTFLLFVAVALLIPVTARVLHDNRLDSKDTRYAGIVAEITARDNTRGSLLDRAGRVIAETVADENGDESRLLYYKESAAHLVGTMPDKTFGSYGAEYYFNALLVGVEDVNINNARGNDVYLTADMALQEKMYELMGNFTGACVVTDCKTGAVLGMVSTPGYDPSAPLSAEEAAATYTNGEYVNIAMAALTPGSVFKLLSTVVLSDNAYTPVLPNDEGYYAFPVGTITNAFETAYENVDIAKAIEKSSNVYFSRAVYELCQQPGKSKMTYAEGINALGMNAAIATQFGAIQQYNNVAAGSQWELLQSAFGQGELLVSPLYMNIFVSAATTDGVFRRPYFLLRAQDPKGRTAAEGKSEVLPYTISEVARANIRQGMLQAANGYGLTTLGYADSIFAKTGTAEISDTRNNVWLTCSFPAENPQYTITMVKIAGLDMSTVLIDPMQQLIDYIAQNPLIVPEEEPENKSLLDFLQ